MQEILGILIFRKDKKDPKPLLKLAQTIKTCDEKDAYELTVNNSSLLGLTKFGSIV